MLAVARLAYKSYLCSRCSVDATYWRELQQNGARLPCPSLHPQVTGDSDDEAEGSDDDNAATTGQQQHHIIAGTAPLAAAAGMGSGEQQACHGLG